MYLVRESDNVVVAFNDDYIGLASQIIYKPSVSGNYRLIISGYSTSSAGFCDLYKGIGGASPTVERGLKFAGTHIEVRWKAGEWFETDFNWGSDPYLYLIAPFRMFWNDDGDGFPNAKIVPPSSGTGTVILGSYSRYTEGNCHLALVGQSYVAPHLSPSPLTSRKEVGQLTGRMKKYLEALKHAKPALEKVKPEQRDKRVLELQRKLLSEDEIRLMAPKLSPATPEFIRRQRDYLERCRAEEKSLKEMPYSARTVRLSRLKQQTLGEEYLEPLGFKPSETARRK